LSLIRQLSELVTPDSSRWKPMLMALAAAMAGVEAVALLRPSQLVTGLIVLIVMFAWVVGACAMIGYVRWMFRSEVERAKQDAASGKNSREK
jgi:hypothetical protein